MAGSRIRGIQSLIGAATLVVVALPTLACGPSGNPVEAAARLGIDPATVVDVGTAALAPAVVSDGRVSIIAVHESDGEWLATPITSSPGQAGTDSLHLFSYGGATGEEWNSFVFGTAAPRTLRVELTGFPDQLGGTVVGGAWIIALREKDLYPQEITWRFVNDDGSSRSGTGIFPPDA
jgi:hypothetical protein